MRFLQVHVNIVLDLKSDLVTKTFRRLDIWIFYKKYFCGTDTWPNKNHFCFNLLRYSAIPGLLVEAHCLYMFE